MIVAIRRMLRRLATAAAIGAVLAGPALAAEPLRVVAFGDSLTAGYGLAASEAFPARLQRALAARGLDVVIENAGVSGDTASAGLGRLDWSVPDGTRAVLLELGANDMLRGVEPAQTKAALDEIITRLESRGIAVMILGMRAAPNLGPDYQRTFDAIFGDLAAKHAAPLYPFFLDGVAAQRGLNLSDGLHPNAAGVDRIVERITPAVEAFLRKLQA
jgi:acyl-CoA thioesterase-1